jgi:DNA-binding PadR family transcriptional regulator
VLSVLLEGPCHGYEVATRLKMRVGPSWRIYAKHLYPVLSALERDLLVRSEESPEDVPSGKRPGSSRERRIYHALPEALAAREEWMATPASLSLVRADMQARLVFSRPEEAPALLGMLERYEEDLIEALEDNAAVDTPRVSWLGLVLSQARASVSRRLDAELAWVADLHRDIEEFTAESR